MTGRPIVAVATDVGAWRVIWPVVQELRSRGKTVHLALAEPAAGLAAAEGVAVWRRLDGDPWEQARLLSQTRPAALLLGTSTRPAVIERRVTECAAGRSPTLAVLDAALFAEQRFGPRWRQLPDLTACPDDETAEALRAAGAPSERLAVTGNPALEEIGQRPWTARPPCDTLEVLFVSQPVPDSGGPGDAFAADERQTLSTLIQALAGLPNRSDRPVQVRVRWHPTQRGHRLPDTPPGVAIDEDTDPDRLRSAARAHVVVGLSSSLLTEARMLPRAAIAYLPGLFWDRELVFPPYQGVAIARSEADLAQALAESLSMEPAPAPRDRHIGAAARVADEVMRLATG